MSLFSREAKNTREPYHREMSPREEAKRSCYSRHFFQGLSVCICISQIGNDEAQWSMPCSEPQLEIAGSHTNRKRCVVLWQMRWGGNRESRDERQRMEKDEYKETDRQTHLSCRENQIVQFLNLLEKSGQILWMKILFPNSFHWAALVQDTQVPAPQQGCSVTNSRGVWLRRMTHRCRCVLLQLCT